MRLRQVAWVAGDLGKAEAAIVDELGLDRCFRDPGVAAFGLHNALFPIGDQFLEVVSPLAGNADTAGGRHLERRGGDSGYMVILQTDQLEAVKERATKADVRIVFEALGGEASDGTTIRGIHFHPKDVGGAILSIDQSATAAEWAWAGPQWRDHVRDERVRRLTSVTIEVVDPEAAAATWSALVGIPVADDTTIELDDAIIRFVNGDRGVVGLGMKAGSDQSSRTFELLGTRVHVTQSETQSVNG